MNKLHYKGFLIVLKYLPYLIALMEMVNTATDLCNLDLVWLTYLSGVGVLPVLFMLLTSFTFKYCSYHRMPIYYILVNNAVITYDYYIGIPVDNKGIIAIYFTIAFIFITLFIILHIKEKNNNGETFIGS